MTAKDFLALYKEAENQILLNRQRMIKTERRAWELCSRSYFEYSADFEDRLWEENERLAKLMADIERVVNRISDKKEREVLTLRYIDGKKWSELAEELLYSEQHIHRIHQKALEKLILPPEYNLGKMSTAFKVAGDI